MTYRWASLHVLKFLVNILAGEGLGVFLHLVAREETKDKEPKKKKEKQPAIRKEGVVLRPSFLMDLFLYVFFFSEDWVKQVT